MSSNRHLEARFRWYFQYKSRGTDVGDALLNDRGDTILAFSRPSGVGTW